MKQRTFLSILCFVLISFGVSSVSAQTCMNNENFRPIITYQANLRLILSSLPSNVTAHNGFYKGSIGQEPDRVDAVGMCIPGSASDHCSKCIKSASDWLMHICPNQTDAYWWALDPTLCLVSYSNSTFSGSADYWALETQYLVFNTADISSYLTDFKNIWGELILGMISETSVAENHYKAKLAALTPFQYIYALMQCTPDISTGDCDNCLRKSVDNYRSKYGQKQGGYVMRPICFFRWQLDTFSKAFANITLAPPPSPPLLKSPVIDVPQPPSAGDRDKNTDSSSKNISMRAIVAIVVVIVVIIVIIIIILALLACRFALRGNSYQEIELNQTGITTVRSLKFNFKTIKDATNKFSESNKLGQGGFGEVFKGMLPNGKEVAVKRLSRTSKQGEKEFKNEVVVVAKLQHRNLVRLLGFSVKGEERILVYEFVPNKSLDCFLSDPTKQGQLDWTKRYNIITGITRGILYLHQDSRLTIIHRDLKADNILLDANMNPKIADFGMARIFGMDQSVANTSRIAGTFGYMPPEYMNQGLFSMKSDVYSFGVLVLEIICGKKNTSFYTPVQNLVTYAWRLWRDESPLELVDLTISESCQSEEVTRCIHIALLCVQEDPKDRPDLSTIMSMLTNNSLILPVPKPPGFFFPDRPNQSTMRSNSQTITDET